MHGPWLFPCLPVSHFPSIQGFATENRAISQPRFKISEFENLLRKKKINFQCNPGTFHTKLKKYKEIEIPPGVSGISQVRVLEHTGASASSICAGTGRPDHSGQPSPPSPILLHSQLFGPFILKKKMKSLKPKESFRVLKRV